MKRCRYMDIVFIVATGVFLCLFVSLRIVVKEILVDRMGVMLPGFQYILYDLNTTVEKPEGESFSRGSVEEYVEKCRYKLNAYTTSAMVYNQNINVIVSSVKKKLVDVPAAYSAMRYVSEPSKNVIAFSSYLEEQGIPFIYISTPRPESILCRTGEMELKDYYISERSWFLLQNLKETGITTIDLAQELADIGLKSYDTSIHWFPACALYSAEVISEYLNRYGFGFDSSLFDEDNTWDYFQNQGQWQKLIYDKCGYQYVFPIPNAATGMRFRLEHEGTVREGEFEDVFLQEPGEFTDSAYHGFSVVSNSTLHRYSNADAGHNAEKRILIIGDSFNWILADYLAVDIGKLDVIHNASYTSSIREYIEETNPDIVLMVYNDAEFSEVYTEQAFDLD